MSGYLNIPGISTSGTVGASFWKNPVADFASLPASGNSPGDARNTLDDQSIYIWDGSSWVLASGGGGGGITQLTGGVTAGPGSGSQAATVVSVGGASAANIGQSVTDTQAATAVNTASTVVKRDVSGNFAAENVTIASLISETANPASAGVLRLANNESINWRNFANSGDLGISIGTGDTLQIGTSLEINNGHIFQSQNKTLIDSSGFITYNVSLNGAAISGAPVTNTAVIFNTYNNVVAADDDFTSAFGFGMIGVAPSLSAAVAATKTIDLLTGVAASIQIDAASAGGTLTDARNYTAFGIFNNGGSLTVDNCVGFYIHPNNGNDATNAWGIRDDSSAENNLNRLSINTSTQKVSAGTVGLEIENKDLLVTGTGNVRIAGNLGVGNSAAATTPGTVVNKIEIFDAAGVSLGFIAVYDSIA
jgi:hypothetical protein